MRIVWDEPKRLTNLANRGLDFAGLTIEFFAQATLIGARHGRSKAIGELGGLILAVIFRPLGNEAISIVSMRRASRKERDAHEQAQAKAAD
jgi:uncharacterized DUF497 family protein